MAVNVLDFNIDETQTKTFPVGTYLVECIASATGGATSFGSYITASGEEPGRNNFSGNGSIIRVRSGTKLTVQDFTAGALGIGVGVSTASPYTVYAGVSSGWIKVQITEPTSIPCTVGTASSSSSSTRTNGAINIKQVR